VAGQRRSTEPPSNGLWPRNGSEPLLHQEEHGSQDGGVVAYVACKCEVQSAGSIVSTDSTPSTRRHPPRRLACATLCPERPRPRMAPGSDRSSFGLSPCSRVITPYPVQFTASLYSVRSTYSKQAVRRQGPPVRSPATCPGPRRIGGAATLARTVARSVPRTLFSGCWPSPGTSSLHPASSCLNLRSQVVGGQPLASGLSPISPCF
jgi:hypothetical protein